MSSGGGEIGGYGFRDYALPVVVYATDNYLDRKIPDAGRMPGRCRVLRRGRAFEDIGGYIIGISAEFWVDPTPAMESTAEATGSIADTDGDGMADDLLVFEWSSSSAASWRRSPTPLRTW